MAKKLIYSPISVGQLFDQISILEIKNEKIKDEEKTANIKRELKLLKGLAAEEGLQLDTAYYYELKSVNKKLWKIEDIIREKERAKEFDIEFIELARSIYHINDRRSAIKRKINLAYSSEIIEEKQYAEYITLPKNRTE